MLTVSPSRRLVVYELLMMWLLVSDCCCYTVYVSLKRHSFFKHTGVGHFLTGVTFGHIATGHNLVSRQTHNLSSLNLNSVAMFDQEREQMYTVYRSV